MSPMLVTVVHSPGCHLCDDAQDGLAELSKEFLLRVELVDARSAEGRRLLDANRAPMYPLVLLDGEYVSSGRLPRRKLRRMLERRVGEPR